MFKYIMCLKSLVLWLKLKYLKCRLLQSLDSGLYRLDKFSNKPRTVKNLANLILWGSLENHQLYYERASTKSFIFVLITLWYVTIILKLQMYHRQTPRGLRIHSLRVPRLNNQLSNLTTSYRLQTRPSTIYYMYWLSGCYYRLLTSQ